MKCVQEKVNQVLGIDLSVGKEGLCRHRNCLFLEDLITTGGDKSRHYTLPKHFVVSAISVRISQDVA